MQLSTKEFIKISVPILQAINYSFNGQNNQEILFKDVQHSIQSLDYQQALEFWKTLSQIHQCDIYKIQTHYNNLQLEEQQLNSEQVQRKLTKRKRTTDKVLQTQILVKYALIQVCQEYKKIISAQCSDKELCQLVNHIVGKDSSQTFWNKVCAHIPSKSKKQIYDFYHSSFSKALYDQNIDVQDKELIQQLCSQYTDAKPAELAEIFLKQTRKNILKRSVVMQFVSVKRLQHQLSQQETNYCKKALRIKCE
ncbi:Hypothetical_protein [Hexamita inflata]|uniref:Hypothetical_protein n=1 Tax=Hexamita inflata TaxID=28002 RepID=A0AA86N8Z0_9EUKA|nr:Hypothetical protein HINF_LOCUS2859 [Hexamita inflata]